jgi:hypothetical protein
MLRALLLLPAASLPFALGSNSMAAAPRPFLQGVVVRQAHTAPVLIPWGSSARTVENAAPGIKCGSWRSRARCSFAREWQADLGSGGLRLGGDLALAGDKFYAYDLLFDPENDFALVERALVEAMGPPAHSESLVLEIGSRGKGTKLHQERRIWKLPDVDVALIRYDMLLSGQGSLSVSYKPLLDLEPADEREERTSDELLTALLDGSQQPAAAKTPAAKIGEEGWWVDAQAAAHLSEQQVQIVRRVVDDCKQRLAKNDADTSAALAESDAHPKDISLKLGNLRSVDERQQIITSHIQQLKAELGEDSFRRFDAYVTSVVHPYMGEIKDRRIAYEMFFRYVPELYRRHARPAVPPPPPP